MGKKRRRIKNNRMKREIEFDKVTLSTEILGEDEEETIELYDMLKDAEYYLCSFSWCTKIIKSYMGFGYPGIVAVSLFKIIPSSKDVDDWIWVINGDLPSAYMTTESNPNPAYALAGYINEMRKWVNAAKYGDDVSELIPVNVPPTAEWAFKLEKRLNFLESEILSMYLKDLS